MITCSHVGPKLITKNSGREICRPKKRSVLKLSPFYIEEIEKDGNFATIRDELSLRLFNTFNLHLLGENKHYQFFSFQFIFVLFLTVIQSLNLTAHARVELCKNFKIINNFKIIYYIMRRFKTYLGDWQRTKVKGLSVVNFIDNSNYIRIINNLFCYSFAFIYCSEDLNTSRLSTHPLELKFGEIRQGSQGKDTSQNAILILSKSMIRDELLNDLGKNPNPVRGRCKASGSTNNSEWTLNLPNDINFSVIPNELVQICNNEMTNDQFIESHTLRLTLFLFENTPTYIPNISNSNTGSRIISRILNHEKKKPS